ncbi:MAG TPA: outer membrane lipid asymmetry maintenance protein MlaD [Halioglobus sp.]
MQQKMIEISVGLLMLAGMAALAFLALQVSARGFTQSNGGYELVAYFTNVAGLTDKAKVSLAGVTVGQVKSIEIVPASMKAKVTMKIKKDVDYLSIDSSAVIQTAGVLGEKYVAIYPGSEDDVLEAGAEIYDTQSSMIFEDMIGKLVTNLAAKD